MQQTMEHSVLSGFCLKVRADSQNKWLVDGVCVCVWGGIREEMVLGGGGCGGGGGGGGVNRIFLMKIFTLSTQSKYG